MTNRLKPWVPRSTSVVSGSQGAIVGGDGAAPLELEDRRHPRVETWQQVEVKGPGGIVVAEMLNLSVSGAMIRVPQGNVPKRDERVSITLADGTKLDGTIVWVNGSVAGVRFGIYLLDVDDFLSFEHLGYSWYSSLIRLQRKRQGVAED